MNNQNNNNLGIPNIIPNNMNNQGIPDNGINIPGANLTPIGPSEVSSGINQNTQSMNNSIPGIVTGNTMANNMNGQGNMMPSNNNSAIPNMVNIVTDNNNLNNQVNVNSTQTISQTVSNEENSNNNQIKNNPFGDDTPFTNESFNEGNDVVLVKEYLKYLLLIFILPIGFIVYLVKAFSKKENKNIKNFAKALLLFSFILVVVLVSIYVVSTMV